MPQGKTDYQTGMGCWDSHSQASFGNRNTSYSFKMADFTQDFQSCTTTMHTLLPTALQMA